MMWEQVHQDAWVLTALPQMLYMKQIDILISKNQVQILYHVQSLFKYNDTILQC